MDLSLLADFSSVTELKLEYFEGDTRLLDAISKGLPLLRRVEVNTRASERTPSQEEVNGLSYIS